MTDSVDGWPNRRNKAGFSNSSDVVLTHLLAVHFFSGLLENRNSNEKILRVSMYEPIIPVIKRL